MFEGIGPTLILAVVRRVVQEFQLSLDELHNDDSTTVSFSGAYDDAAQEGEQRGRPTPAITPGWAPAALQAPVPGTSVVRRSAP